MAQDKRKLERCAALEADLKGMFEALLRRPTPATILSVVDQVDAPWAERPRRAKA